MADAAAEERDQSGDLAADQGGGGRFWLWVLGAVSLVGGLTWILLHTASPPDWKGIAVGVVIALGGLVLLMPHRVRLPRRAALVALATGVAGALAGLLVKATATCCMYAYTEGRGFPFVWLSKIGTGDTPDAARRIATGSGWGPEVAPLLVNVFVWAYAGIVVLTVVTLVRRRR